MLNARFVHSMPSSLSVQVFLALSTLEVAQHQIQRAKMASSNGTLAHLLPTGYKRMVSSWLEEDCPSFDYGGFVVGENMAEARLLGKSPVGQIFSSKVVLPYFLATAHIAAAMLLISLSYLLGPIHAFRMGNKTIPIVFQHLFSFLA